MNNPLDKLDEEIAEGAASPVSGVVTSVVAGEALATPGRRRVLIELPAYLCVQTAWFAAFGLQTVLFPYMLKNLLDVSGTMLGIAQIRPDATCPCKRQLRVEHLHTRVVGSDHFGSEQNCL